MSADWEAFRQQKDAYMKTDASPLTPEQRANFQALDYFSYDPSLVFTDVSIDGSGSGEPMDLQTSAGDSQHYQRAGTVSFTTQGQTLTLNLYQDPATQHLFLPFKDQTNSVETYHDGRYLEVEALDGCIHLLDFNYAYNPYCAYNKQWRCPITPEENTLPVPIRGGEKLYPGTAHPNLS
jgi:uncharacterized protein (DUF1684 family)